jgi:hypothetical protein
MTALEVYMKIQKEQPNLVEILLQRQNGETIYGELSDWLRDYYTLIPMIDREMVAKMLLGQYVIKHPYCLQKNINK